MPGRRPHGDAGSSVVDFSLVSVLVVALFLIVMQVGVVLHARNVMIAAAAEGARYGANADRSPDEGVARTRELLGQGFGAARVEQMSVREGEPTSDAGLTTVEVVVEAPLPVVFFPAGPVRITVRGHALEEGRP